MPLPGCYLIYLDPGKLLQFLHIRNKRGIFIMNDCIIGRVKMDMIERYLGCEVRNISPDLFSEPVKLTLSIQYQ